MAAADITEDVTIKGKRYRITALGTAEGRRLFFKLIKLTGPSIGDFMRGGGTELFVRAVVDAANPDGAQAVLPDSLKKAGDLIADAGTELLERLDEATFNDFYETFAKSTSYIDSTGDYRLDKVQTAFQADYGSMLKWMAECLKLNFASFLADLGLTGPRQ